MDTHGNPFDVLAGLTLTDEHYPGPLLAPVTGYQLYLVSKYPPPSLRYTFRIDDVPGDYRAR